MTSGEPEILGLNGDEGDILLGEVLGGLIDCGDTEMWSPVDLTVDVEVIDVSAPGDVVVS